MTITVNIVIMIIITISVKIVNRVILEIAEGKCSVAVERR